MVLIFSILSPDNSPLIISPLLFHKVATKISPIISIKHIEVTMYLFIINSLLKVKVNKWIVCTFY